MLHSAVNRLNQSLWRQTGRQGVDRLNPLNGIFLTLGNDVIGMGHLPLAIVNLNLAANHARFADGQSLSEVVSLGVKKGEGDPTRIISAGHFVRKARVPSRRRAMGQHLDSQGANTPRRRVANFG